jgi:hypothetical protein
VSLRDDIEFPFLIKQLGPIRAVASLSGDNLGRRQVLGAA